MLRLFTTSAALALSLYADTSCDCSAEYPIRLAALGQLDLPARSPALSKTISLSDRFANLESGVAAAVRPQTRPAQFATALRPKRRPAYLTASVRPQRRPAYLAASVRPQRRPAYLAAAVRPQRRPADITVPGAPVTLSGASELECIAVAIYHEARGETDFGKRAVASVILQRAAVPDRWGNTPCAVVAPVQFSFMANDGSYAPVDDQNAWSNALDLAAEVIATGPLPELRGADHYHRVDVNPNWNLDMDRVRQIAAHVFYRDP